MELSETAIPGCFIVEASVTKDARGWFVKMFHLPTFAVSGLRTDWAEDYYTSSSYGVVRGMHFQVPPVDHAKLVFCVLGEVVDVVLDLRVGSPCYGEPHSFLLSGRAGKGVYIPSGCAHGFASLSETSLMCYKVTTVYSPEHDTGINWSSIGFDWPVTRPIISKRDMGHPTLADFVSPFRYSPHEDA